MHSNESPSAARSAATCIGSTYMQPLNRWLWCNCYIDKPRMRTHLVAAQQANKGNHGAELDDIIKTPQTVYNCCTIHSRCPIKTHLVAAEQAQEGGHGAELELQHIIVCS
jgi:hypothetical protein